MNYFVTKRELLEEIEKAVNGIFTAIAKLFSEEDKRLNKRLRKMESEFLLLISILGQPSHQSRNKRSKKMEEPRAIRLFEEVLDEVVDYVLHSEDHELILLIDELEKSAKEEVKKKEKIKGKLREIFKEGMPILKEHEGEKKGKG